MEKNIFEGAKFGDKFVCENGKIAIYVCREWDNHRMVMEGRNGIVRYEENGHAYDYSPFYTEFDIVSRYQEPIDEEKLDELANENFPMCRITTEKDKIFNDIIHDLRKAFKAGYRKAKERYEL